MVFVPFTYVFKFTSFSSFIFYTENRDMQKTLLTINPLQSAFLAVQTAQKGG